jgi:hypothetical protein
MGSIKWVSGKRWCLEHVSRVFQSYQLFNGQLHKRETVRALRGEPDEWDPFPYPRTKAATIVREMLEVALLLHITGAFSTLSPAQPHRR